MTPQAACRFFLPAETTPSLVRLGKGNVNDTWLVTTGSGEQWVLQRLRSAVFGDPRHVMHNLRLVVNHLSGTQNRFPLFSLCCNPDGKDTLLDTEHNCWRMLSYLEGTQTLETIDTLGQAHSIGEMLGRFHLMLSGIDQNTLTDPLPGFHIPSGYLTAYDRVMRPHPMKNQDEAFCSAVIEAMRPRAVLMEDPSLRVRQQVIHGDPKVANFLFSPDGKQAVSLIDLDTVKPGLLLHDLGDCLRSCCNPFGEATEEPAMVQFDTQRFHAVLEGYCQVAAHLLHQADRQHLVDAVHIISFELGLRFFTDHLSGNTYFRTKWPGHNLQRALVQFHLCNSVDRQRNQLNRMVDRLPREPPLLPSV